MQGGVQGCDLNYGQILQLTYMYTIIYVHSYTYVWNAFGNTWRGSQIWPPLKIYMYTYIYLQTGPLYLHACTHKHLYTRHLAMKGKNQCLGLAKRAILILALCLQPASTPFLEPADQPRRCLQPHTSPHPDTFTLSCTPTDM